MRLSFRSTCLLAAAVLVGACAPKGPAPDAMIAAANAVDQAFLDAFNTGDVNALMATYWNSPELVNIGLDGMGDLGWDGAKAGWEIVFASMPGVQLAFDAPVNIAAGDVVLGWGAWTMTVPAGDGTAIVLTGRYSDVKAMRDGKWVYIMDHASVPMPPAPAAP